MALLLFDMDGTLTPARRSMSWEMAMTLCNLSFKDKIGIVSGSGLKYIEEQTVQLKEVFRSNPTNFFIMPCNGTKLYQYRENWKLNFISEVQMKDEMSDSEYSQLVSHLMKLTIEVLEQTNIDPTGTFIQYRGSMVNWCPIGRDSSFAQRQTFEEFDKREDIRGALRKKLLDHIDSKLEVVLGGSTSLDIYPKGWDKTYALRHFPNEKDVYFVGDKCKAPGNDASIFDACAPRSFETTGPEETLQIIKNNFARP